MLGRTLRIESRLPSEDAILLTTLSAPARRSESAYMLRSAVAHGRRLIVVAGQDDRGVLYGVFALLRRIALHREIQNFNERSEPYAPVRWTNEWDQPGRKHRARIRRPFDLFQWRPGG